MRLKFIFILVAAFALTSCKKNIVGSWTIEKYETTKPGDQNVTLSNIGTMTFYENGSGEKNISYTVFDLTKNDNALFEWSAQDKYLTIKSENSEFAKTWIVVHNRLGYQEFQSTDGNNQVQVLALKKITQE